METRASHIAVGAFVMLLLLGGFGFVIWVSKFSERTAMASHFVRFSGSVQGLNAGSSVLFGGIPIGHVTTINVDPKDSSLARVDMTVNADAPIRTDSIATLELQGITGGVLVEISRGSARSDRAKDGSEIASGSTALERLLTGAPELISKGNLLLDRATMFLSSENAAAIGRIFMNVDKLTSSLVANSDKIATTLNQVSAAAVQITEASTEFGKLATDLRAATGKLTGEASGAVHDIHTLATHFSSTADSLDKMIDENRQPIHDFTGTGLCELSQMITEVRILAQTVNRISIEFERDPARFFFGDRQKGFTAQ
ncbi:MAG TPA: MlaD family protein [Isosphaeraceae bacterium]|nr:MlaD family protein [Isosphaeraceae bacterium]